jgi:Holliday junction resolvasome RuvABC DNA-binding subunit
VIAALHGTVLEKSGDEAIIEVAGVGTGWRSRCSPWPASAGGGAGRVRVRTVVREDAFELYASSLRWRRRCSPCSPRSPTWGRSWR